MHIIITENITIHNPDVQLATLVAQDLTFPNPKYVNAQKYGYSLYKVPKVLTLIKTNRRSNTLILPRGYQPVLFKHLQILGLPYELTINTTIAKLEQPLSSNIKLRDYQNYAVDSLLSNTFGVIKAPAGSGKTVMGIEAIVRSGQKALWLTHTGPLLTQAKERFLSFVPGISLGIIGNSKWSVGNEVTLGMVQTLIRNEDRVKSELSSIFGIVALDEAHHASASTFTDVLRWLNPERMYGFTATDKRRDQLEGIMYAVLGPIVAEIDRQYISDRIITPTIVAYPTYLQVDPELNYTEILRVLTYNEHRNALIVEHVLEEAYMGNLCILVTERVAHAEILYDLIRQRWDFTGLVVGKLSKKQVTEQISLLESKKVTVLVATSSLIGEGFDYAPLNRLFICQPFRNEARCEQIVGRVQRVAPGKEDSVIYDYVDDNSLLQHQYFNTRDKACRRNVYERLGCKIEDY